MSDSGNQKSAFDIINQAVTIFVSVSLLAWMINLSIVFIVEEASGKKASLNSHSAAGGFPYFVPALAVTCVLFFASCLVTIFNFSEKSSQKNK